MRSYKRTLGVTGLLVWLAATPAHAVVINEVHYNPTEGSLLEFIELFNPFPEPVSLAGWSLTDGLDFAFPSDAVIEAGGFLVVCKAPEQLIERFGLAESSAVLGGFGGRLSNSGERVTLINDVFRLVDTVRYNDNVPWDSSADGEGPSLQRLCARFEAVPGNWRAATATPLAPTGEPACPPPAPPPSPVTFHELHYQPVGDDPREEFVEIRNNTDAPVALTGYSISGIDYVFGDVTLPPQGHLAVARDPEHLAKVFDTGESVGPFAGRLSNGGERLVLRDAGGTIVDTIRYRDRAGWPAGPDGTGRSLEKVLATAPSEDPASWRTASFPDVSKWTTVQIEGRATGSELLFYLSDRGALLIDNVRIVPAPESTEEFDQGYDLDGEAELWTARGNHAASALSASDGVEQSGAFHLISEGAGNSANTVALSIEPPLPENTRVIVTFQWRHLSGTTDLIARLTGSSIRGGIYYRYAQGALATPGKPNTAEAARVPALVGPIRRVPQEPRSADTTWISTSVRERGAPTAAVFLEYRVNDGETVRVPMSDDGPTVDDPPLVRIPGDGYLEASVPPQAHNTVVTYRIVVEDDMGERTTSPLPSDPSGFHAFYVSDLNPDTELPVYTLLVEHASSKDPVELATALNCNNYRDASFAYRGDVYYNLGLRARGESVCGSLKRYLKVRFHRGNFFKDVRKLNFQSMWTDKSLVREYLTWNTVRALGAPHATIQHVRLHMNGEYFGLYAELEHPDERYLERNGLDPNGNLYKAINSTEQKQSNYAGSYEKESNEDGDYSDLTDFIDSMHATPTEQLVEFFSSRVDEDAMIRYFAAHTTASNNDFVHKNHFLYHDPSSDRWFPQHWDVDQSYGKGGVWNDAPLTPGGDPWNGIEYNHLLSKFFSESGSWYRRAYLVTLWEALHEKRPLSFYEEEFAFLRAFLTAEADEDYRKWGRTPATPNAPDAPAEFEPNLDLVEFHVPNRQGFLVDYLRDQENFSGYDRLKITELMYNPLAGQELEYIELWNPSHRRVDVSGWHIDGVDFAFPADLVIEPQEVIVVAKDPEAFATAYPGTTARVLGPYGGALSNGGETLRVKDAGPGFPASVDTLRYDNTSEWPLRADGRGASLELHTPEPNTDSDLPEQWRASEGTGTPGQLPAGPAPARHFRRGDVNADGRYNIIDGLQLLRYLAGATTAPGCVAALDVDADGFTNLTDAVFLLNFIFVKNSPPPISPGPGECTPAPLDDCRVANCTP